MVFFYAPKLAVSGFVFMAVAAISATAYCSAETMKAPPKTAHHVQSGVQAFEPSLVRQVFLGAIVFYRHFISPTSGNRCGFHPTCSTFGHQAIKEHGPVKGVMMTADRLTRCNFFKEPDSDYYLLPNGKLFDPVSNNTLKEQ